MIKEILDSISIVDGKVWKGKTKDGRDCQVSKVDESGMYGITNIANSPNWTASWWDLDGKCMGTSESYTGADIDI
jgi:alpha-glucuronidase